MSDQNFTVIRKAKKNEFLQVIVLAKRKTKQVFQTMISGSICLRQLRYPNLALSVILIHEHILNLLPIIVIRLLLMLS